MFDLVFLFTGLCAFALDPPGVSPAQRLDVVLVSAPAHQGLLVVDSTQVVAAVSAPTPINFGQHNGYPIHDKVVRIRGAQPSGIRLAPAARGADCPLDEADLRAFSWVVPLSRLTTGSGRMRADLLNPSSPPPTAFHAKVELLGGELSTRSFATNEEGKSLLWEFNSIPGAGFEMALADLVEVRQRDLRGEVILDFVDLNGGTSGSLTLAPRGRRTVLVEIFNLARRDTCCSRQERFTVNDELEHFGHLLEVLPATNGNASKPKAVGTCPRVAPEIAIPGRCSIPCNSVSEAAPGNPQCPGGDSSGP